MLDPLELLLDLLFIRWLLNDEGSRLLKIIVCFVILLFVIAALGLIFGWL